MFVELPAVHVYKVLLVQHLVPAVEQEPPEEHIAGMVVVVVEVVVVEVEVLVVLVDVVVVAGAPANTRAPLTGEVAAGVASTTLFVFIRVPVPGAPFHKPAAHA